MSDRPLPQNLEAERGMLGIILEENDALFNVSNIVTKADFIEPFHGELYILLKDMIETGREAKPSTVMHDLSQDADIGGVSASAYLAQLQREAPHGTMAQTFAKTIRDLAMRRRLIAVALQHVDEAFSAPATISALEIESRYHAAAEAMFGTVQEAGMMPLEDIGMAVLKDTQKALQGDRRRGLRTGLKALDDLWGPLMPGRLYSLAGASGSGKTALAQQVARNCAEPTSDSEEAVLFMSLEMDGEELGTRDFTQLTGIPSDRIESADLNVEEFDALVEAQKGQTSSRLIIDSDKNQSVASIRGKALRLKRLRGLKLLVIDHWRYMKRKGRELFEEMHDDLRGLNAIADDLQIPVLVLAQLKSSYGSEAKLREPNIGDIFNGAVLEQESDALMLVHRPEYILARKKPNESKDIPAWEEELRRTRNRAWLLLNKRRGGQGYGSRPVGFDGPRTMFTDAIPAVNWTDQLV